MDKLFALVPSLVGVLMLYMAIRALPKHLAGMARVSRSRRWPRTTGRVVASGVNAQGLPSHFATRPGEFSAPATTYSHEVEYEYRVGPKEYRSSRKFLEVSGSGLRSSAQSEALRLPVGSEVDVYYDPKAPSVAVLYPGLRLAHFAVLLVIVGIGVLGAAALIFTLKALRAGRPVQ